MEHDSCLKCKHLNITNAEKAVIRLTNNTPTKSKITCFYRELDSNPTIECLLHGTCEKHRSIK